MQSKFSAWEMRMSFHVYMTSDAERFSSGKPFLLHTGGFLMTLNFSVTNLPLTAT